MTFDPPTRAYVWVWLPGQTEPTVMGQVVEHAGRVIFAYGRSYRDNPDAWSPNPAELPIRAGDIEPLAGMQIAGVLADARPDAWGQRVIEHRLLGEGVQGSSELTNVTYLLHSGSDRIGALDFQESATEYVPRRNTSTSLEALATAAQMIEDGLPLDPALEAALEHGTAIGGARPKALVDAGDRKLIAKFSSSTDRVPAVRAEFLAMQLAARCGLNVADTELATAAGRDVLLVERFDREQIDGKWHRHELLSALTLLQLDEYAAHHDASYAGLAEVIRTREFAEVERDVHELFGRMTFNILCGNDDDHARNHAALRIGPSLELSPAYDIDPRPRSGGENRQVMSIGHDGYRMSQVAGCIDRAASFLLSTTEARAIVDRQIETITHSWQDVCDLAGFTQVDRNRYWQTAFLNPYSLYGL